MSTTPTITEQTVDVWGGRLAITVKVAGAGAPLLYLHPAAGLAWDPFLSHLASRYTVYAPEFPAPARATRTPSTPSTPSATWCWPTRSWSAPSGSTIPW